MKDLNKKASLEEDYQHALEVARGLEIIRNRLGTLTGGGDLQFEVGLTTVQTAEVLVGMIQTELDWAHRRVGRLQLERENRVE